MSESERRLVLVDGTAVLYRSFYAIQNLCTRDGRPTNAVFGFLRTLRHVEQSHVPTHWAIALDSGLPRERIELLDAYKAQRPPMPTALRSQVDLVVAYLDRARISVLRQANCEADDLIASVAAWAEPDCEDTRIMTSDKDLYQIVTERIRICPLTDIPTLLGPREIEEKTGVKPRQIPDWLALTGDTSDNIPGVPGIGAKTAARLLREFDSVTDLFTRIEHVPSERLRQTLRFYREEVLRNRQIVQLRRDVVPQGTSWEALRRVAPDASRVEAFLRDLEFDSVLHHEPG